MSSYQINREKTLELIEALHRSYTKEPGILDANGINALQHITKMNEERQRAKLRKLKRK